VGISRFERLKSGIRWLKRKIRGKVPYNHKQLFWRKTEVLRHYIWSRGVTIGKDGRVCIPVADILLAHECNLKCEFCFYLHPFRSGIVPKEALFDSFEKWSHKAFPKRIVLTGGEPLLHPDIAEMVTAVRHYWQQSRCEIWTNGYLLPHTSDDILRVFAEQNASVFISQHLDTEEFRDILKQSLERLKQFNIPYIVFEAFRDWRKDRRLDADGVPVPCQSDPAMAHGHCTSKRNTLMHGDYMYRCNFLAHLSMAIHGGVAVPEWNRVLTHKPVTFESSPQEIRDYLCGGPMSECSVCPETREIVESKQLSVEDVQRIKELVRQRIQKAT